MAGWSKPITRKKSSGNGTLKKILKMKKELQISKDGKIIIDHFPLAKLAFDSYSEWFNDYITVWAFARDKGIHEDFAEALIREGRRIHEMNDES